MIILPWVSFPLLYAETHYRFKYFFSFLKKSEPEVLADLPHRLDPDAALPILLLVKDSHHFPIELTDVTIELRQSGKPLFADKHRISLHIAEPLWWKVLLVPFHDQLSTVFGLIDVDVSFEFTVAGIHRSAKNDNYRTSSKASFQVYRSAQALPSFAGWVQGDTHTHSSYTDDQVEFGAPIAASVELSKAMGLSFFCVTDHSYDLDDRVDNYLVNDPGLPKWKLQQQQIDEINSKHHDFAVLRGEEVSCSNREGRNVHFLLWGTSEYFEGSGDSAERWFRTDAEHSITDVLSKKKHDVVAYAGHPTEPAPLFQWLLIKRGQWYLDDMSRDGLDGLQILNGDANRPFFEGLESWVTLLLRGRKIFIAAGNDAHGNFNRFRQIGIPFFTIREHNRQLFGKMRTAVRCESPTEASLLKSLQHGRAVITNGPLIVFSVTNEFGETAGIGEQIRGVRLRMQIRGKSSEEFGTFFELKVIFGRIGTECELIRMRKRFSGVYEFDLTIDLEVQHHGSQSYTRLEGFTKQAGGNDAEGFCYTNPLWITRL